MTRKQFAVVAVRLKEELNNIKTLLRELSDKGLVGSKKKIRALLPEKDTFILRAVVRAKKPIIRGECKWLTEPLQLRSTVWTGGRSCP